MNSLSRLFVVVVFWEGSLCAFAADLGPNSPNAPTGRSEFSRSSVYTPRNGYFGDLTLLAKPTSFSRAEDSQRTLGRVLNAIQEALRLRLEAIDARIGQPGTSEATLKELVAERESILARQKAVSRRLEQIQSSPDTPPATTDVPVGAPLP